MKVTPRNRQILLAECKSPQSGGRIVLAKNEDPKFFWGCVVARDETPYVTVNGAPQPAPVAPVGSLVYYEKAMARPILADGDEIQVLLHEMNILAVDLESTAELKHIKALPIAAKDIAAVNGAPKELVIA